MNPRLRLAAPLPFRPVAVKVAALVSTGLLAGCQVLGPTALSAGRGAYNDVIARTNSEQTLAMLVRMRYADPTGILTVTSVTAGLKFSARIGGEFGLGPTTNYDGNLVPLSAGAAYEDNPTITYSPVDGQAFLREWLSPISLESLCLIMQAGVDEEVLPMMLVERMNGLRGGPHASAEERRNLRRAIQLLAELRRTGAVAWVEAPPMPIAGAPAPAGAGSGSGGSGFELMLAPISEQDAAEAAELLQLLGLSRPASGPNGAAIRVPLVLGVRTPGFWGVAVETRSVAGIMQHAAAAIEVPERHIQEGVVRPSPPLESDDAPTFRIRSSSAPPEHANVAVQHRGWWFWVDDKDFQSKRLFKDIQILFQNRLAQATKGTQTAPLLTIPVGG
ncbi:MAG: hypothetical protein U0574_12535 [Phycisphaerales bacterium]